MTRLCGSLAESERREILDLLPERDHFVYMGSFPNPYTDTAVQDAQCGGVNTSQLRLVAATVALPDAQASVAVNSLGLLDLVQIAMRGLTAGVQYRVYLAQASHSPYGNLEPSATFKANPDGGAIVQTVGPLKELARIGSHNSESSPRRFLIVADFNDPPRVGLRQASPPNGP